MGRTSFVIVPERLKGLRKDSGMTQYQLISKAYKILGRSPAATSKTLIGHYQRIEKNGKTSKALAQALADVLNVTVEVLQGKDVPEQFDYMARLVNQIRSQLSLGRNQVLKDEFNKWQRLYNSQHTDSSEDIYEFARHIGVDIETAQLTGQPNELERFCTITGWDSDNLLNPANVHGHWFVRKVEANYISTDIEHGLFTVIYEVEKFIEKHYRDNMNVSIRNVYPWIHIDISNPSTDPFYKNSIIFSRVLPTPNGLKWVSPSETDKWNMNGLDNIAFTNANFVTLNDGVLHPSDVRNLRLKVIERIDDINSGIAYTEGWLTEQKTHIFNKFVAEGEAHSWTVNQLTGGLTEGLRTHLYRVPDISWRVNADSQSINLTCITRTLSAEQRKKLGFYSLDYTIRLVELMPDGSYRPAPWAKKSIDDTVNEIKDQLKRAWSSDTTHSHNETDGIKLHFETIAQD